MQGNILGFDRCVRARSLCLLCLYEGFNSKMQRICATKLFILYLDFNAYLQTLKKKNTLQYKPIKFNILEQSLYNVV